MACAGAIGNLTQLSHAARKCARKKKKEKNAMLTHDDDATLFQGGPQLELSREFRSPRNCTGPGVAAASRWGQSKRGTSEGGEA